MRNLGKEKRLLIPVNRPPALTWKHLGVNGSELILEAESHPAGFKLPPAFAAVPSGMGTVLEKFILEQSTGSSLWEVPAGEHLGPKVLKQELTAGQPRSEVMLIHAGAGSRLKLVQVLRSAGEGAVQHTGLTKIIAEAGAQVLLVQVQMLNSQSVSVQDVGIQLQENAQVKVCQAELGGAQAWAGCLGALQGTGSRFDAQTFYFGDGRRRLDLNYVARHEGRKTQSYLQAAGLLLGASRKIYRGTLDFRKGAVQSQGREEEDTLLFSSRVRNLSVPFMLCGEEAVEGHHAATIGRLNAARLFYLQSRGLTLSQIKNLAVQARFAPLWELLPEPELCSEVRSFLQRRINIDGKMGSR